MAPPFDDDVNPDGPLAAHQAGECDPPLCPHCEAEADALDDLFTDLGAGD